jgi:rubredoxin
MAKSDEMYQCQGSNCGYIYNPDKGCRKGKVPAGVCFDEIPENYRCPSCGSGKKMFRPLTGTGSAAEERC